MTDSKKSPRRKSLDALRRYLKNELYAVLPWWTWPPDAKSDEASIVADQDRALAILAQTALEEVIKHALIDHFAFKEDIEALFGEGPRMDQAPLATFASRIRIAHALGIIGRNATDDLQTIRHIRNTFAHTSERITFDTKEVADAAAHVTAFDRAFPESKTEVVATRQKFKMNVEILHLALLAAGLGYSNERLGDPINFVLFS